jgi:hypothetical protein
VSISHWFWQFNDYSLIFIGLYLYPNLLFLHP